MLFNSILIITSLALIGYVLTPFVKQFGEIVGQFLYSQDFDDNFESEGNSNFDQ